MSELYDLMLEKFGSSENFIKHLCEKQSIPYETNTTVEVDKPKPKCKTIDELIKDLEYWKSILGDDAFVNIDDSSGYQSDVILCYDDNDRLWQLDKDLLGNGKLYSPENVCFLPASINSRLSSFDNFSFDAKKSFFGDIYENYFDVFEDEVLEAFFEMSKFDFGLNKEQRLTLEQKVELENKEKEISEIRNDVSALHIWDDINNPRQSVKFLNGWYYVDLTRKGQKVTREKFSCVYDAVLRKIDLKVNILNDLNTKYCENDLWYSEGFDKIHFDKLVMLSELNYLIKSGELVIPQWIEVNKAYKGG